MFPNLWTAGRGEAPATLKAILLGFFLQNRDTILFNYSPTRQRVTYLHSIELFNERHILQNIN